MYVCVCMYVYVYTYIYIYIYIYNVHTHITYSIVVSRCTVQRIRPVSVRKFPSFRTQPLENLSQYLWKRRYLSNPAPGENLLSGNLVMETGCKRGGYDMRPISLLTLSPLRLPDSNFPGNALWAWEFHPLKLRLRSSRTLWNPQC